MSELIATCSRTLGVHADDKTPLTLGALRGLVNLALADNYPDTAVLCYGPQNAPITFLSIREGE